jgi:hypothetical protein
MSVDAPSSAPELGRMTEPEFRSLYDRLRAQVPWRPDDRRGALNYITPAEMLAARGEMRLGRTVSLAAPVEDWETLDNPDPAQHQMKEPLGADAGPGLSFSMDRIAMNIHGNADTHIDALCHVIFDGELYHGVPAETVSETGAAELSIAVAADGIVGTPRQHTRASDHLARPRPKPRTSWCYAARTMINMSILENILLST